MLTADPAADEAAEQVLRTFGAGEGIAGELELRIACRAGLCLASLDPVPQSLVHYAQLGLVANDPLAFGIEPGTAGEAAIFVWDLDPTAPIEDAPADVDRVVEDAFAERDVARQGRGVPDTGVVFALFPRTRRGHTLVVEDLADGLQAVAVGVELEDPQN